MNYNATITVVDFVKFLNSINTFTTLKNTNTAKGTVQNIPENITYNNDVVFTYFQLASQIKKIGYYNSDDYKFFKKLITLNTKNGYKLKSFHIYSGVLNYIYSYFHSFDSTISEEYPSYKNFFEFSKNFSQEFYKPDFFIKYIHLYLELIFLIKKVKPKKKLKKKKTSLKTLVSYIPNNTRSNITLRIINSYVNNASTYNSVVKIGNAIMYLAFAGKNSFLYKKKLSMYNKLLEKKKFY